MRPPTFMRSDFVRFGVVSVAGLGVDFTTAWVLSVIAHAPLPLAALCGFCAGGAFNYLMHELWTFRHGEARPSIERVTAYLAVLAAALGVRVGMVVVLQHWVLTRPGGEAVTLIIATGASFLANYGLSKRLVFRQPSPKSGQDVA